tara:strand:+ start:6871 stop:8043 length:1173 start_codon:yes stop_codon:yes gene_type:complete
MKIARRVNEVPPYLFVEISRKIAEKRSQGIEVISFGIGDPDLATPANVIEELRLTSLDTPNHRYPESDGLPEFKYAVSNWYDKRFGVSLDPDSEVVSLIGAKEGIGHAAFCFIEPGDVALIPDPGYPVYSVGTLFAGGDSYMMPLSEDNAWLPNLDSIPEEIARKSTVMWLNYPNNPTSAVATLEYFEKVVAFAKKYNIAIMHDACYTEIAYDGYEPPSFLQAYGAKDVGIEFHSLSKTYNMTGWRLGMAVGNPEMINSLMVIKSNLDSGVPQAIQHMGIEAMNESKDILDHRIGIYQSRRDRVVSTLTDAGLKVSTPKASLYVWASVPDGYNSARFSEILLEDRNVLVSPGSGYGKNGEGYIRLSLTIPEEQLEEGLRRMSDWKIPATS